MSVDRLLLEGGGRLSLWAGSELVWMAGPVGCVGTALHVQDDGNLVLYDQHRPVWSSDTFLKR